MATSNAGGLTFFGLLQIVFIVLKLLNVINWSWWLVLLPLWGPWAIIGLLFIVSLILGLFD